MTNQYEYNIEDLFQSVNDIYAQYDDGDLARADAVQILLSCCEAFIEKNKGE